MQETKKAQYPFVVRTHSGSLYQYTTREAMEATLKTHLSPSAPTLTIYVAEEQVEIQAPPVKRFPVDIS